MVGAPRATRLWERLGARGETLHAPHLFDLEVLAAIRRNLLHGVLPEYRARRSLAALAKLRLTRYPMLPF